MNDDPNALAALLPTHAEATALAASESATPADVVALAAIRIDADILRRETWSREVELSSALFDRYATEMPLESVGFVDKSYKLVDLRRPVTRGACTACMLFHGKELCVHCGGRSPNPLEGPCPYCKHGYIVCRVCDGTERAVRATLRLVNDRATVLRRVVVPSQLDAHASRIESIIDAQYTPPAALRFALQANVVESAYRGASAVREPEFHGHAFEDALARALDVMTELARHRDAVRMEVRTYAWPLLLLRVRGRARTREHSRSPAREGGHDVVLVKDASGNLHRV